MPCPYVRRIRTPKQYTIKDGIKIFKYDHMRVKCGKCLYCKSSIKRDWLFRMEEESRRIPKGHFTTLTYADHALSPIGLDYSHIQQWLKIARWEHYDHYGTSHRFKFFAVGEYAQKYPHRPHWHVLTWNADEDLLRGSWTKGFTYPGKLTTASVRYCINYLDKPMYEKLSLDPNFQGVQEMRHMSKGIGKNFLHRIASSDISQYAQTAQWTVSTEQNLKLQLPRYYFTTQNGINSLFDEDTLDGITALKIHHAHQQHEKLLASLKRRGTSLKDYYLQFVLKEKLMLDRLKSRL